MQQLPTYFLNCCFAIFLSFFSIAVVKGQEEESTDLGEKYYSIFLIGDAGEINPPMEKNFESLKSQMEMASDASATVFLGDNITYDQQRNLNDL